MTAALSLLLLVVLVPSAVVILTTLLPFYRASRGRKHSLSFGLADMLWLTVMVQYPLLGVHYVMKSTPWFRPPDMTNRLATVALCLVAAYLWARGVGVLNALGVRNSLKRGALLAVILPGVVLLSILGGPVVITSLFSHADPGVALGLAFTVVSLVFLLRALSSWVLSGLEEVSE